MRVFPRVCEIFLIWPVMCIYGEPFVSDFSPVFLPRSAARRIATVKIFLRISDIILQDRNFINRNKYFFCFICICFQRSIDWQENPNKNIFSFEIAGNWSSLKKENIPQSEKDIYIFMKIDKDFSFYSSFGYSSINFCEFNLIFLRFHERSLSGRFAMYRLLGFGPIFTWKTVHNKINKINFHAKSWILDLVTRVRLNIQWAIVRVG